MLDSVKDAVLGRAMRLMSDPRLSRVMGDPRVMNVAMKAVGLGGTIKAELDRASRFAAGLFGLATQEEVSALRSTVQSLEDNLSAPRTPRRSAARRERPNRRACRAGAPNDASAAGLQHGLPDADFDRPLQGSFWFAWQRPTTRPTRCWSSARRAAIARRWIGWCAVISAPLFALCLRYVRDADEAADLVQRSFVRAMGKLADLRDAGVFRSWLLRIGAHLALNHIRDHARFVADDGELEAGIERRARAVGVGGVDRLEAAEQASALREAVNELPTKQRMTLELRIYEDLPFRDIGVALGISEGAAKVNFHYAVRKLRGPLSPADGGAHRGKIK